MESKKAVDEQSCSALQSSHSVFEKLYPVSETATLTIVRKNTYEDSVDQGDRALRIQTINYIFVTRLSNLTFHIFSLRIQTINYIFTTRLSNFTFQNVPFEIKLPTGCYTAKLDILDYQWFHGFFWVHPLTALPDLNNWNTTFFLEPRPLT